MNAQHCLLWASGEDNPGIVSAVTKALLELGTNLEDSSMMRLGSEFAIFLIFSSARKLTTVRINSALQPVRRQKDLTIGVKEISARQAQFRGPGTITYIVSVHGHDRPGIVHHVTETLARRKFNITDLSTHRTTARGSAGYIMFIEGELRSAGQLPAIRRELAGLARRLGTRVEIRPVSVEPL